MQGFYSAYENHLPIRLTPDIIWLLIVQGFAEPIAKSFPVEYAVEMNRLINLELEGTIG